MSCGGSEADVCGRCKDQKGQFRVETTAWEGELATNKS